MKNLYTHSFSIIWLVEFVLGCQYLKLKLKFQWRLLMKKCLQTPDFNQPSKLLNSSNFGLEVYQITNTYLLYSPFFPLPLLFLRPRFFSFSFNAGTSKSWENRVQKQNPVNERMAGWIHFFQFIIGVWDEWRWSIEEEELTAGAKANDCSSMRLVFIEEYC